ncbi:MAG: UDP-N-acetylmuramate--L-alanine ligase [SAR324 cluster bacterium]|nr:UDP-N-acetylmuramate--L-alanine ligase [SAR324 cluster bacterium]
MTLHSAWHYHFLGIGGVSMSALAELLHRKGLRVSGSDAQDSALLRQLDELGIPVSVGHAPSQLDGVDAVIYTTALSADHRMRKEVRRRKLPEFHRAQLLGALTREGKALAVTGTHGKTTTTACLAVVLEYAGWDPTALVGGQVPQFGGSNLRLGAAPWMVVEADESDGSFIELTPWAVLLTNIEADHLDQHGSFANLIGAFEDFLAGLQAERPLVYCLDDAQATRLAGRTARPKRSYGTARDADVRVSAKMEPGGGMRVVLRSEGREHGFTSSLGGRHNALNMAGVFALAREAGMGAEEALRGLAAFQGVARRQQYLGTAHGCKIFDDYAHHPTEVRVTLEMFLECHGVPVTVVFQPHLYSRTAYFAQEFADALRPAQRIIVTDVYGAREAPVDGVSGRLIVDRLADHPAASYLEHWDQVVALAKNGDLPPGVLITMGAGDIAGLAPLLLQGGPR